MILRWSLRVFLVALTVLCCSCQGLIPTCACGDPNRATPPSATAGQGIVFSGPGGTGTATVNEIRWTGSAVGPPLLDGGAPSARLEVDITITATTGQVSYKSGHWTATDTKGLEHTPLAMANEPSSKTIGPGESVHGIVSFNMPYEQAVVYFTIQQDKLAAWTFS